MPRDLRTRKSRNSTPIGTFDDTNSPPSDTPRDRRKTLNDFWSEPVVKNPAPSFEEHGFARFGVLETMQALGTPPSAKLKQKVRATADPTTLRTVLGKNGNLLGNEEGASTPEITPAPELERDDSERQEEEDLPPSMQAQDEEDDDDYVPTNKKAKVQAMKSPARGTRTPKETKTPVQKQSPPKNGTARRSSSTHIPSLQNAAPSLGDLSKGIAVKQRMQIVLNDAIQRSIADHKPHLGAALRKFLDLAQSDAEKHGVCQAIVHRTWTEEQYNLFHRFVKDEKKAFKRSAKQKAYNEKRVASQSRRSSDSRSFVPGSPSNAKTPNAVSPSKNGIHGGSKPGRPRKHSRAAVDELSPHHEDNAEMEYAHVTPNPLTTAPTLSAKPSPSPHGTRKPSKSPRKPSKVNNHAAGTKANPSGKAHTPSARTPDSVIGPSNDDDSDLSDVNEEIVQNGPPEPVAAVNGNDSAAAPVIQKLKIQAPRGGKKPSRANSAKPNGRWEKKALPTAEELAEELALQQRRQEMAEKQPARLMINPPTSDVRYEDDLLETESLTESQIAVGPPVDANRLRRAGRGSRPGLSLGKRLRDESSAIPSSPLESAGTSRPSTPAVAVPPSKRIKLSNGTAARTKRSPVKNRDGPIAGVAHTGGGSRQLGPDDLDPDSPPSESDDFCSACKGTGEFVCCDGCTRVFHFLCCDPPREDPPTGSFFCYECEARSKPNEELTQDVFTPLGPLLRGLKSINPRSFALPNDLQTYFEGVSVRSDGSYAEEVKKFALTKSSGYGYQKPDYLKTHDAEQNPILCCQCGKSTAGKRPMLKCDYCHAYWHLDCCDPPLANPPPINLESSNRDAWKCPRHLDHDLRSGQLFQHDLNAVANGDVRMLDANQVLRVKRKVRKPRQASTIEPTFSRGMRNNGMVDIINDPDDDTDGEGNYVFASDESKDQNLKVFRVPEKGIITDFITKVKSNRVEQKRQERKAARLESRRQSAQQQFAVRPIEQQQAALHLAQLANKQGDAGLTESSIDALILRLTAEAPDNVVSALSEERRNSAPGPVTDAKRAELIKIRDLIDRLLASAA